MHARVPVIASDVGGIPELIEHGTTGLLFRAGDPEDLAEKIRVFVDNPHLVDEFAARIGPVRSLADDAAGLLDLYRETLARKSRTPETNRSA